MKHLDHQTFEALETLLAQPDPPDLPRRAIVMRYPGDPKRRQTRMLPILTAWFQHRCVERDPEPWIAPAKPSDGRPTGDVWCRRTA